MPPRCCGGRWDTASGATKLAPAPPQRGTGLPRAMRPCQLPTSTAQGTPQPLILPLDSVPPFPQVAPRSTHLLAPHSHASKTPQQLQGAHPTVPCPPPPQSPQTRGPRDRRDDRTPQHPPDPHSRPTSQLAVPLASPSSQACTQSLPPPTDCARNISVWHRHAHSQHRSVPSPQTCTPTASRFPQAAPRGSPPPDAPPQHPRQRPATHSAPAELLAHRAPGAPRLRSPRGTGTLLARPRPHPRAFPAWPRSAHALRTRGRPAATLAWPGRGRESTAGRAGPRRHRTTCPRSHCDPARMRRACRRGPRPPQSARPGSPLCPSRFGLAGGGGAARGERGRGCGAAS